MANFLVVGLLVGHRYRGSRRFLLGFEVFGTTALALYIAMAILFSRREVGVKSYLEYGPISNPLRENHRANGLGPPLPLANRLLHPLTLGQPPAVGLRPDWRLLIS